MIVFCEECGRRYCLNQDQIISSQQGFKCQNCDFLITVHTDNSALTGLPGDMLSENSCRPLRVLIVDDSKIFRRLFTRIIESDSSFLVVGEAANGNEAVELNKTLKPDLITLDVTMPGMGGASVLKRFMLTHSCPVVIVSSLSKRTQGTIIDFLRLGAVDFFAKPHHDHNREETRQRFIKTLQSAGEASTSGVKRLRVARPVSTQIKPAGLRLPCRYLNIILSGAGGYGEIFKIIHQIPRGFDGTFLVVQAMPQKLVTPLLSYLNQICAIPVLPLEPETQVLAGHCYIGANHPPLVLQKHDHGFGIQASESMVSSSRPVQSNARLLGSIADQFPGVFSITLVSGAETGTLDVLRSIKSQNGKIVIQKPATCMVGKPIEEIAQAGLADAESDTEQIVETISDLLNIPYLVEPGQNTNEIGTEYIQKRQFQRLYFTYETGPRAQLEIVRPAHGPARFEAIVMDVCEDGMGLLMAQEPPLTRAVSPGHRILIKAIRGSEEFAMLSGTEAEIRWILNKPGFNQSSFGCTFRNISNPIRQRLREITANALKRYHQTEF
jgi:two-component system chemotaxis response regulator CheB